MSSEDRGALRPLLLLASLFFLWGFLTSMNDILIPYLKGRFELSYFQAMLVQFAFFGAYFVGSLIYFAISVRWSDPIARIGYQRGAVGGLLISGLGALGFLPAASLQSFPLFLTALFVLGLGFTLLQISANPYVTVLGPERTASARLNLCQGFNSLGTTLGPLIGGALILSGSAMRGLEDDPERVRGPYGVFAGVLLALAVVFSFLRLPRIESEEAQGSAAALRHPNLVRGIVAIFCYVGAEVAVGSILINFLALDEIAGLDEERGSAFVAVYWGGLMIGRFLGALLLSSAHQSRKVAGLVLLPVLGFLFLAFSVAKGRDLAFGDTVTMLAPYGWLLAGSLLAFVLGASRPGRTTGVFALCAAALLAVPILRSGELAMWAVIGVGLFNSILWSNIFSLSIEGLGRHKSQGSSLLVMAIVGGALLPPAQGWVADTVGVRPSFLVPLVAYLYLAWFGFRGHRARLSEPIP